MRRIVLILVGLSLAAGACTTPGGSSALSEGERAWCLDGGWHRVETYKAAADLDVVDGMTFSVAAFGLDPDDYPERHSFDRWENGFLMSQIGKFEALGYVEDWLTRVERAEEVCKKGAAAVVSNTVKELSVEDAAVVWCSEHISEVTDAADTLGIETPSLTRGQEIVDWVLTAQFDFSRVCTAAFESR